MMRVVAARHVDVQVHAQLIGKGGKKLVRQIRVEIAYPPGTNLDVVEKIGPAAQIDDYLRQRFIEGTARLTEAADALLVAQRVFERLPQRQADVFNRMMIVDFEIALGLDLDVEKAMAA